MAQGPLDQAAKCGYLTGWVPVEARRLQDWEKFKKICSHSQAERYQGSQYPPPPPYPSNAYVQAKLGVGSVNFCTVDFGGAFSIRSTVCQVCFPIPWF